MPTHAPRALSAAFIATLAVLFGACDGGGGAGPGVSQPGASTGQAQTSSAGNSSQGPDTSQMGQIILDKINAKPGIEGKASLVEFKEKSVHVEALGEVLSAVVEFEGVVVFSGDVEWRWQGPTKAGEPVNFEARAEYINDGKGWQLFGPMGIYPI